MLPARYQSSRFPGKPLVPILGKPMILRTYEQVCFLRWDQACSAAPQGRVGMRVAGWLGGPCSCMSLLPARLQSWDVFVVDG